MIYWFSDAKIYAWFKTETNCQFTFFLKKNLVVNDTESYSRWILVTLKTQIDQIMHMGFQRNVSWTYIKWGSFLKKKKKNFEMGTY